MRSEIADKALAKTPQDVIIFARLYGDLVVRIDSILKEKGLTQKALADQMEKSPSEIHKWLSGEHNFTLRSLAKPEAELGEPLLEIPKSEKKRSGRPTAAVGRKDPKKKIELGTGRHLVSMSETLFDEDLER